MPTWLRARLARRDDEGLSGPAGVPQAQDAVGFAEASPAWPMAHFVKWCRARFFNGYRPVSVLQPDGQDGRSDTEALLRGGHPPPSPCPPPAAPSPGPPGRADSRDRERTPSQERAARRERLPSPERERERERDKEEKKTHLNFEEFECDVSVEGGVDEAGQERQEFSFTLYDFDGHGKITKDDITGLVSTIYETLGASIKVPHYGSKTIKVKLTVSPDKRAAQGGARGAKAGQATYVNASASPAAEPQSTPPRVRFKRDLNVTIQERRPPRPRRASSASARRRPAAPPAPRRERESERDPSEDRGYVVHSCSSSCRSGGGSEGGDAEMDGSADEDMGDMEDDEDDDGVRRPTGLSPASVAAAAATAATMASAAQAAANGCQSPHVKKRSSSLQRQELLQIIQANMEKMAKKSCGERTGLEERRHSHSGVHPHRHRQRQKATLSASASPQRIYDYATTPYYVNLVEKGESAATGDADTYRYVVCSSKHQPTYLNVPCRERGHNRSRSHDLTTNTHNHAHAHQLTHNPAAPLFRYTLLQEDNTSSVQAFNVKPARSPAANRRVRLPPAAVGHTSSPHHLKHRNREQDQARAMAQVVQWLEQEFSASLNTRTTAGVQEVLINAKTHRMKSKSTAFTSAPETPSANSVPNASGNTPRPPQTDEDPAPQAAGVKQHEHRHVHEHIHHHYHHYQDAAPVLV